mgnify:CR=1 FL=1
MIQPKGIIAAMSTPFFQDETLNEAELRHQVDRLIAAGLHGIFTLGTNGENYAMDFDEKARIMEIVIDQAAHRVPIYVGTGCVTTKETVALTRKACELGADCASVVSPWFAENTQEGLYRHYRTVAECSDLPVLIYNMPARTGVNVHYKTMKRLAEIPNIVGVKDSSGNFDNMQRYLEECQGISVLSGNDSLILPCLLAGGQGGISGISNVFPGRMVEIYTAWEAGDLERAWKVQRSIRPLRDCMAMGNPNSVVKRAAFFMGQDLGPVRAPFNIQDETFDETIKKALAKVQG